MATIDDVYDDVMGQTMADLMSPPFYCVHCGDEHKGGEPGFTFPDRLFGLDLTQDRREELADACDGDTLEIDGLHFVRGVHYVPVDDGNLFGIGFWVQLDYEGAEVGRIANQSHFLAPTLGVRAAIDKRPDLRPMIHIVDEAHPLARAQHERVARAQVVRWMSDEMHADESRPGEVPFDATLATHGWEILAPAVMGKQPLTFLEPPAEGDNVKVTIRFLGAGPTGEPMQINAGWWLRIWDTSRPDVWGATLASIPRVPAPLMFGSPVWVRREQIFEHDLAE